MKEFDKLKKTVDTLRSPKGCPWDKQQTHQSLIPFLYEETYEVADTIINGNVNHLKEELGDLLLQILLHSRIAEESNNFTIKDVIEMVNNKLIRRHPHVFGDINIDNSEDVIKIWESIKKEEKKDKKFSSIFDDIPNNFPPLLKSYKLQKAASRVGFDWKDYKGVLDKIEEELAELKEAIQQNSNIEHELGDILFAIVNLCKFLNISAETSLAKANMRFIDRFNYIEKKIVELNKNFEDFNIEELEQMWQEAKKLKN